MLMDLVALSARDKDLYNHKLAWLHDSLPYIRKI